MRKTRVAGTIAVAVLTLTSVSAAAVSAAPVAATVSHDATSSAVSLTTSHSWSGFEDKDSAQPDLHGAIGGWTVPTVVCSAGEDSVASVWAGIGGDYPIRKGVAETLYQAGTDSDCSKGSAIYYAWQEEYGAPDYVTQRVLGCAPNVICFAVSVEPGNKITASVIDRGLDTHWSLTDDRYGRTVWTHSSLWPTRYQHRHSAECIVEGPKGTELADFGSVHFSNCQAVDQSGTLWDMVAEKLPAHWFASELEMEPAKTVLAEPWLKLLTVTRTGAWSDVDRILGASAYGRLFVRLVSLKPTSLFQGSPQHFLVTVQLRVVANGPTNYGPAFGSPSSRNSLLLAVQGPKGSYCDAGQVDGYCVLGGFLQSNSASSPTWQCGLIDLFSAGVGGLWWFFANTCVITATEISDQMPATLSASQITVLWQYQEWPGGYVPLG
jgi:hypothetical protein